MLNFKDFGRCNRESIGQAEASHRRGDQRTTVAGVDVSGLPSVNVFDEWPGPSILCIKKTSVKEAFSQSSDFWYWQKCLVTIDNEA